MTPQIRLLPTLATGAATLAATLVLITADADRASPRVERDHESRCFEFAFNAGAPR